MWLELHFSGSELAPDPVRHASDFVTSLVRTPRYTAYTVFQTSSDMEGKSYSISEQDQWLINSKLTTYRGKSPPLQREKGARSG